MTAFASVTLPGATPMFDPPNYAIVEGTEAAHSGFFPTQRRTPAPPSAVDLRVPVAGGVEIGCRFHTGDPAGPNILYFHGNGETVYDYDDIAPMFTALGLNLFFGDYRGYGSSSGSPSFPTMLGDAHLILTAFMNLLETQGLTGPRFVMGRSMGGHSAVELAAHHPEELSGLILESSAPHIGRLLEYLKAAGDHAGAAKLQEQHIAKIRAISMPVLAIHGERDDLIPLARAVEFFDLLTMPDKRMERIPRAGHNNILWAGTQQYLNAVLAFVGNP
ncbi:MAG: alpha/beta fold hydrolase [Dehalococcoidia bacterium]|nr:alpha/beta fold hydrolase [Dehalococcoidia bacterium]